MIESRLRSAAICHAASDGQFAGELGEYLGLNCPGIAIDREEFSGSGEFLDAVGRALSADYPIVLLSPAAVPRSWRRPEWEPVLVEEARRLERRIGYVWLQECKFPEVLRGGTFFDFSKSRLAGQRSLKRWLIEDNMLFESAVELPDGGGWHEVEAAAFERLQCRLADQPGVATDISREFALGFAHGSARDFEGVFWVECAHQSRAGILGDSAQALGLKLRGPVEENARSLQEFCAKRRILVVLAGAAQADAEWATSGGRSSFMFVAGAGDAQAISLEETTARFGGWRRDPDGCLRILGQAQAHLRKLPELREREWEAAMSMSLSAYSLLRQTGRLAEAYEFLEAMIDAARTKGNTAQSKRLEWEKGWILEEWGKPVPGALWAMSTSWGHQLKLFE